MGVHEAVHLLLIDMKNAYDSVRREVLYNIVTDWVFPTQRPPKYAVYHM
jgi:hypothetical protein